MHLRTFCRQFATVGYFLAGSLSLSPGAASDLDELYEPGSKVVIIHKAKVKVGDEVRATISPWSVVEIGKVQGDWISVTLNRDDKSVSGWVYKRNILPVPQELQELDRGSSPNCGVIGCLDPVALASVLSFGDLDSRIDAGRAIEGMGPRAVSIMPVLIDALQASNYSLRISAAIALGRIGPEARDAIPRLVDACRDAHPMVRLMSMRALGRIGSAAVPPLIEALKDSELRHYSAGALLDIGEPAIVPLIELQATGNHGTATLARNIVVQFGERAIPGTMKALDDSDPTIRCEAVVLLVDLLLREKDLTNEESTSITAGIIDITAGIIDAFRSVAGNENDSIHDLVCAKLVSALKDPHRDMRLLTMDALLRLECRSREFVSMLTALLRDPDEDVRLLAARSLGKVGPDAFSSVPALIELLDDPVLATFAAEALASIGESAVESLSEALQTEKPAIREAAVYALGQVDAGGGAALPKLMPMMQSDDKILRFMAARAVANAGTCSVPALIEMLQSKSPDQQILAAQTLSQIGSEASDAADSLAVLVDDENPDVRADAIRALSRIGKKADSAVDELENALENATGAYRLNVAWALWTIAEHRRSVPVLVELLEDEDPAVRLASATALGQIGPKASEAVESLSKLLSRDEKERISASAATALARIGSPAKMIVPQLGKALDAERPLLCSAAALALAELGPDAEEALPALKDSLHHVKGRPRQSIAWALWEIDKHPWAVDVFGQALKDTSQSLSARMEAANALRRLGAASSRAVHHIREAMQDNNNRIREAAARTLAAIAVASKESEPALAEAAENFIGPARFEIAWAQWEANEDPSAVPVLAEFVSQPDDEVRNAAVCALAKIGAQAEPAMPTICDALYDANPQSRAAAAVTLGRIGRKAETTAPLLIEMLKDPDKTVRYQAGAALRHVEKEPGSAAPYVMTAFCDRPKKTMGEAVRAYVGLDPEDLPDFSVKQLGQAARWGATKDRRNASLFLAAWPKPIDEGLDNLIRARRKEKDGTAIWCQEVALFIQHQMEDDRVSQALKESEVKYELTDTNNFASNRRTSDKRSHWGYIESDTTTYYDLEIREVWAIGYEADGEFPAKVAMRMIEENATMKWGAWAKYDNRAIFEVKIAADADGESLRAALRHVTIVADDLEKDLTGRDHF